MHGANACMLLVYILVQRAVRVYILGIAESYAISLNTLTGWMGVLSMAAIVSLVSQVCRLRTGIPYTKADKHTYLTMLNMTQFLRKSASVKNWIELWVLSRIKEGKQWNSRVK